MSKILTPQEIVAFWRSAGPAKWFVKDPDFDLQIRNKFAPLLPAAKAGELDDWLAKGADGYLSLILLLDQVPRNSFRDSAKAWSYDSLAKTYARKAIDEGVDRRVEPDLRGFIYLPFMHSEDLADQKTCVALFEALGDKGGLNYARIHLEIIERFGRFPHRNAFLGRTSDEAERAFLKDGGFQG